MPDDPKPATTEPAPAPAAASSEVKKDVGEAAGAVGEAASTATHAGESLVASALAEIQGTLKRIEEKLPGQPSVTKGAEAVATPVKPAEQAAEAVVPDVKVTPRKAHWTSGLPKWM